MIKWEYYIDSAYYDMWAVRPEGDRNFNSPRLYHFMTREDAVKCCELLNKAVGTAREVK